MNSFCTAEVTPSPDLLG